MSPHRTIWLRYAQPKLPRQILRVNVSSAGNAMNIESASTSLCGVLSWGHTTDHIFTDTCDIKFTEPFLEFCKFPFEQPTPPKGDQNMIRVHTGDTGVVMHSCLVFDPGGGGLSLAQAKCHVMIAVTTINQTHTASQTALHLHCQGRADRCLAY